MVLYFTGTGNSRYLARCIAEGLGMPLYDLNACIKAGDTAPVQTGPEAAQVGVDRCFAEVLPEDKAAFVRDAKAEGHTVVMIGDGINDSPALCSASTRPSSFWGFWASCPLPPAPCCITFPPLASACAA